MTERVYICSPLSEAPIANLIAADLRAAGFTVVSTWHANVDPTKPEPRDPRVRREILETNLRELARASAVVAWTASGTPKGTYGEIGRALARGLPVVWIQGDDGRGGSIDDADPGVRILSATEALIDRGVIKGIMVQRDGRTPRLYTPTEQQCSLCDDRMLEGCPKCGVEAT